MASKSTLYTINLRELEGHDNLAHNIPEIFEQANELESETSVKTLDSKNKMVPKTKSTYIGIKCAITVDILIIFIVTLWIVLIEIGLIPHFKQGFYCDDRTIREIYKGDTISTLILLISVIIPFFIIWSIEIFSCNPSTAKRSRIKESALITLNWMKGYTIGIVAQLFIAETLKILLGELRPHFIDSCKPDSVKNCSGSSYINKYMCTNRIDSFPFISDSSRSFPSAHSSVGTFEAIYLIWYFHCKFPKVRSKLLLPFCQSLCLTWALLCCITRITDKRHHWWDVLAGAILGLIFAILTCVFLCQNFQTTPSCVGIITQNGTSDRHTSVRRLLSQSSCRDEVTLNHVENV